MWACTVTGSPKPAAMQTIENMENSPRGWYSGCIGFLWFNSFVSTGMTCIQSILKTEQLQCVPEQLYSMIQNLSEENETQLKASAFLAATLTTNLMIPRKLIYRKRQRKNSFV